MRYDGVTSLKTYVQSRGRVRAKGGRCLVLCSAAQEAGMREVQEQEELALRVVRDKASSKRWL